MKFYLVTCFNHSKINFLSRLIRWAEQSDSSHCEIMMIDFEGDKCFWGSVFPFSRLANEAEFLKSYTITGVKELKVTNYKKAVWYLNGQMAKPYSPIQIIFAGIKILSKIVFKKPFSVKLNLTKHLICTELCANFMHDMCGIEFPENRDLVTISELKEKAGMR